MQMIKIALLSTSLLAVGACCRLYPGRIGPVASEATEVEKLALYPDIEEQARISEMRTILMGHHPRVGAGSTLMQLTPPALRQVTKEVSELYPQPKGRRLYLDIQDQTGGIPYTYKKISIKLMTDNDTFGDLSRRLRKVFKIPANTKITYLYSRIPEPGGFFCLKTADPDFSDTKIFDMFPHALKGKLFVVIEQN